MDLDTILPDIGDFGVYQQLLLYFVLLPACMPCGFHAYNQVFMSASPDHWCRTQNKGHPSLAGNDTLRNLSVGLNQSHAGSCEVWSGVEGDNSTQPCSSGWVYDHSKYKQTIVTEWDLVCDRDHYPMMALVILGVGGLIGNYIFGYLQDSLGRRPAFFIYLLIESVFGVATAFAPDFLTWTVLRFGVGFTVPAILGTPYVLAIELVGPGKRTTCTILVNIAYSLALVALAGVVYVFRDWRHLALATSLPFLMFFLYWWVLPESPRWLLARGRYEEAEKILKKMAVVNGKTLPANYIQHLKKKHQVELATSDKDLSKDRDRRFGVWDLFRYPNLRKKTLIITFIWFTNTAVYVGLSYYAPALGGDEFLNFFLAGAVELPTYLFLWPAMDRLGRRWTLCISMVVGGAACLATVLVQHDPTVTLALYCIGKMGISSSFVVLPLTASELYPTVVRGLGMSTSSVVGQVGPIVIPLINYLGEEWLVLPLLVMGALLVAGGASSLLLPETLHQHLPQSLEDGETFGQVSWANCCCPSPRKHGLEGTQGHKMIILDTRPRLGVEPEVAEELDDASPDSTVKTVVSSDKTLCITVV